MTKFKLFFPFVVFFSSFLIFTSCDKVDEVIEAISESDAVEIIETNFQANAGGLVTNIEDVAEQLVAAVTSGELCDTLYSETIQDDFQGAQIQASYTTDLIINHEIENSYEAVAKAMHDMRASIRYFYKDAATFNNYRIETSSKRQDSSSASLLRITRFLL
jgi:hypothetical protein